MQVKIIIGSCSFDDTERHTLHINGKPSLTIGSLSETPEDAIIGRDLVDARDIVRYMQMAYDAGKSGEDFSVVIEKEGSLEGETNEKN